MLQMLLNGETGVNIKSANDLRHYDLAATFGSQVEERLVVLDRGVTAILEERAKGLRFPKSVKDLQAECKAKGLDHKGKKATLVDRLNAADPEVQLDWPEFEKVLKELPDKKWNQIYADIRSEIGVDSFAVGLADNCVAMREAVQYVQEKFGKADAVAYFSILLYFDLQTSEHPLISRCDAAWLESFLENPYSQALDGGFSLKTGPQCGYALFHSLKYVGRLFIYKTVLWNKIVALRLPAVVTVEIDNAVLRIYGGKTRTSHLNFVYGHHVSWVFRNVEVTFEKCPGPIRCIGHLIAALHEHYEHLKPRMDADIRDIYMADVCGNDLMHLAELHGIMYILPLMGQLLAGWNMHTLYWVGLRRAPFFEVELATCGLVDLDPIDPEMERIRYITSDPSSNPPILLAKASDYTIEKAHQTAKARMKNTSAKVSDQKFVMQVKYDEFRHQAATGAADSGKHSGPAFERVDSNGVMCGPCVDNGFKTAKPEVEGNRGDDLAHQDADKPSFLGGCDSEDDLEEDADAGDAATVGSTQQLHAEAQSNLQVVKAAVAKLSALARATLHWACGGYNVFGQPAVAAQVLRELAHRASAGDGLMAVAEPATPYETDLKPGWYAVSVTLALTAMDWTNAVAITVVGTPEGQNKATVTALSAPPVIGVRKHLLVTVQPDAWEKLAAAAESDVMRSVTHELFRGHVNTSLKPLRVCCVCSLLPCKNCLNSKVDLAVLGGSLDFDDPLGPNDNASKIWRDDEALTARLPFTRTALIGCISAMFADGYQFLGQKHTQEESAIVHQRLAQSGYGTANAEVFCGPVSKAGERIGRVLEAWFRHELSLLGVEPGLNKLKRLCGELRKERAAALEGSDDGAAPCAGEPAAEDTLEVGSSAGPSMIPPTGPDPTMEPAVKPAADPVAEPAPKRRRCATPPAVSPPTLASSASLAADASAPEIPKASETALGQIPPHATVVVYVCDGKLRFGELTAGDNTTDEGEDDGESAVSLLNLDPPPRCPAVQKGSISYKELWELKRRTTKEEVARANVLVGLAAKRSMTAKEWKAAKLPGLPPWKVSAEAQHGWLTRLLKQWVESQKE
jgi:hypothetical protein